MSTRSAQDEAVQRLSLALEALAAASEHLRVARTTLDSRRRLEDEPALERIGVALREVHDGQHEALAALARARHGSNVVRATNQRGGR